MKIKKGDNIIVIAGKDRGKSGTVSRVLPKSDAVLVDGINIVKKHTRARRRNERGQVLEKAMPIHISNIALKDPKGGTPTRVGYRVEGGKKVRVARKSGATV